MGFKVILDKDTCIGCGVCASIAPEIFEIKNMKSNLVGMEPVTSGKQERALKDDEVEKAKEASNSCPTKSISVVEV
ncbi:MAG: ferredoxin [Candidatus Nanohaloarchaeota archaeon]|nr:ferredoxin [Candidatus Nanohaloarchaeota archaeon]